MSVIINAKGTSVPYFTIGKGGVTIYQGATDPALSYTVIEGDYWLDTSTLSIKVRSGVSTWINSTGQSGFSGWSGFSGESGFSGISGESGISGWSGISGEIGTSGFSGTSGLSGTSGWSGTSGTSG